MKHQPTCDGTKKAIAGEPEGIEDVDWVSCRECGFRCKTLAKHLSQVHSLSKDAYVVLHPCANLTSSASRDKFKSRAQNFAWLKRAKERGDDLSAYRKKMSDAVRETIMSDPEERPRRSRQLAENNRTIEARERSSRTAKLTSARPDVLEARTLRLQRSYHPSNPERALQRLLDEHGFIRNVLISDAMFRTKTHRRQVDFANHSKKIFIEFDGQQHFMPAWKRMPLRDIHDNDFELDQWAVDHGYALVRVGWKNFNSRSKDVSDLAKTAIVELVCRSGLKGVWLIGEEYRTYAHPSASTGNFYVSPAVEGIHAPASL